MMRDIKVGDQVKFVDQQGGGTVSRILERNRILVLIPEGFEIPVGIEEVIPMNPDKKDLDPFHQEFKQKPSSNVTPVFEDRSLDFRSFKKQGSILLGFMPKKIEILTGSDYELYLINPTEYHLLYSFGLLDQNKKWLGMDFGSIEPFSAEMISEIPSDELTLWRKGFVQAFFHKDEMQELLQPLNCSYTLNKTFFQNSDQLEFLSPLQSSGFLYELGSISELKQEKSERQEKRKATKEDFISKYLQKDGELVVDLHIEKLSADFRSLQPLEILKRQTQLANRVIGQAAIRKIKKVIFIHGVGKGILKMEIQNMLKEYKDAEMMDAPMNKYGVGASEVILWHDS